MNIPNLAVDLKVADYEWQPAPEKPAPAVEVNTVQPAAPTLISAEQLEENMRLYVDRLTSEPGWQEKLLRQQAEAKEARRIARAARLAARQQRKAA
jgi:hypothetical protein